MERVKIYDEHGVPAKNAIGLFARAFMEHFPLLPVERRDVCTTPSCARILWKAFSSQKVREMLGENRSRGALVDFPLGISC